MRIDGRCHCGFIAYEAKIDLATAMICHCTDCQTLTGSAFRTFVLSWEDGFSLLKGKLKTYVKTSDSGTKRLQTFCPECGPRSTPPLRAMVQRFTVFGSARAASAMTSCPGGRSGAARPNHGSPASEAFREPTHRPGFRLREHHEAIVPRTGGSPDDPC